MNPSLSPFSIELTKPDMDTVVAGSSTALVVSFSSLIQPPYVQGHTVALYQYPLGGVKVILPVLSVLVTARP